MGLLNDRFFPENMTVTPDAVETLSVRLDTGPSKGIFTTVKSAANYNATIDDLNKIRADASGPVMTPNESVCRLYLYLDDLSIGAYSAYIHDIHWVSFAKEKMRAYYGIIPKIIPNISTSFTMTPGI